MCEGETLCTQSSSGPHAPRVFCSVESPCVAGAPRDVWGADALRYARPRDAGRQAPPARCRACPARRVVVSPPAAGVPRWSTPLPLRRVGVGRTGPQAVEGTVWALRAGRPTGEREERTQTAQCAAAIIARGGQTGEPSSRRPSAPRRDGRAPKRPHGFSVGLRGGSVSDTVSLLRASRGAEDKRGSRR
jgi:hypothetical protein